MSDYERCTECNARVESDDPYFATPCGTYCEECMGEHVEECDICRKEFPEAAS